MTLLELVEAIQTAKPKAFGKLTEQQAVGIVRVTLAQLAKQIKTTEEGKIEVPVLGTFVVQNVKKEGAETKRRRVIFKAAQDSVKKRASSANANKKARKAIKAE